MYGIASYKDDVMLVFLGSTRNEANKFQRRKYLQLVDRPEDQVSCNQTGEEEDS